VKGGEKMKEIKVEWTGSWPCLCHGEWKLIIDGEDWSWIIPFQGEDADTHGTYSSWQFDENYLEEWDSYEAGLDCSEWLSANADWIAKLDLNEDEARLLFEGFQESDWRHGSCGGCI
jgi:hypothetical protein